MRVPDPVARIMHMSARTGRIAKNGEARYRNADPAGAQ
jgi:hypothetical protein